MATFLSWPKMSVNCIRINSMFSSFTMRIMSSLVYAICQAPLSISAWDLASQRSLLKRKALRPCGSERLRSQLINGVYEFSGVLSRIFQSPKSYLVQMARLHAPHLGGFMQHFVRHCSLPLLLSRSPAAVIFFYAPWLLSSRKIPYS